MDFSDPFGDFALENMYKSFLKDYLADCQELTYRRNEVERQIRHIISRSSYEKYQTLVAQARQLGKGGFTNPEEVIVQEYRRLMRHIHKWGYGW
jgi:hypothetical protein